MRAVLSMTMLVLASAGAHATEVTQTQTLASRPAGWLDKFSFAQSDPALALTGVQFDLTTTLGGQLDIENRDRSARAVNSYVVGGAGVSLPNRQPLVSAGAYQGQASDLGAFDGTVDFAGASGRSIALDASGSGSVKLNVGPHPKSGLGDAARFIGKGTVNLGVQTGAYSHIAAGGNVTGRVLPTVGASGTLTYTQAPLGQTGSTQTTGGGFQTGGGGCCVSIGGVPDLRTTATQTRTVDPQTTGWSSLLDFQSFDPTLGPLWTVNLHIAMPTRFDRAAENLGSGRTFVTAAQSALLSLTALDGTALGEVRSKVRTGFTLGYGFDGNADGAGASGGASGFDALGLFKSRLDDPAILALFSTGTTLDLQLASTGASEVSGADSFWFDLATLTGAEVSLSYTYAVGPGGLRGTSNADGTISYDIGGRSVIFPDRVAEPGAIALFAGSALALGLARRRKGVTAQA